MTTFGELLRERREAQGVTLGGLAQAVHYDKGHLSKIENGKKRPSEELARLCDQALNARGELISMAHLDLAAARDAEPWHTAELVARLQASDATPATLEALDATVFELCCQYPTRDAVELRAEAHQWLRHVASLLRRPVGLRQHEDFLVAAGWLALLIGCLEYDVGMRTSAEATRVAARQLATEAQSGEVLAWTFEMAAWFALTQGRYADVVPATEAGQRAGGQHSVTVQLAAQRAKAYARMGDLGAVTDALDQGHRQLGQLVVPSRPEHHFVVDPAKWVFYAMDAYRLAGDDARAADYAQAVLDRSTTPNGTKVTPMRTAEAHLTLAVTAARAGDLERATDAGLEALRGERRSLPSLLLVASELDGELHARHPDEPATRQFGEALRALR